MGCMCCVGATGSRVQHAKRGWRAHTAQSWALCPLSLSARSFTSCKSISKKDDRLHIIRSRSSAWLAHFARSRMCDTSSAAASRWRRHVGAVLCMSFERLYQLLDRVSNGPDPACSNESWPVRRWPASRACYGRTDDEGCQQELQDPDNDCVLICRLSHQSGNESGQTCGSAHKERTVSADAAD